MSNVSKASAAQNANTAFHSVVGGDASLRTIVTPAANTKGVLVLFCSISTDGGTDDSRLMYKASAPATWDDAAAVTLLQTVKGSAELRKIERQAPFVLPAGMGLYQQSAGATNITGAQVAYSVLA